MPDFDTIVAGCGAMGLSTLWRLAQRGQRVQGFDTHTVPNDRGSSHGGSRAFRLAYFEHSGYVPLLRRALAGWRELEAASGAELLTLTGGLYLGLPASATVQGCAQAAREHGLEHELLDAAALRARWPQFAFFPDAAGVYEPYGGICRVEDTLRALAQLAQNGGAELREQEPVLDWQADSAGVRVVTAQGEYRAARLVLCPGPYAAGLLKTERVRITPTRQAVGWFVPQRPERAGPGSFPVWAAEFPDGQFWYGFAALPGSAGLKLGRHQPGPAIDPQTEPRSLRPAEAVELLDFARRWLPRDAGPLAVTSICLYENTPDGHFVLDWHPDHGPRDGTPGRVAIACGGSGHAFKFTPVIGECMAELLADEPAASATAFLRIRS
jgi:sarcosine oxidase